MTFPLIELTGSPYARGLQFGRSCGDLIRRYPGALLKVRAEESRLRTQDVAHGTVDEAELARRAGTFLPWFERFAPDQVEEIRGVADGADVPFEVALLTNVRAEVFGLDRSGCTALALGRRATADRSMLIAQNQDQHPLMRDFVVVVRVIPDRGPRMLMVTFAGLLGYGGINSHGVGYMMNALSNGIWRVGLPHYPVKRALLEQPDIESCLRVFDRAPVGSCANNLLVDRDRLADVELTPDGYSVIEPEAGKGDALVHTNHFLADCHGPGDRLLPALPDSPHRASRMEDLLRARYGALEVSHLKSYLSDHEGHPHGICRHPEPGGSAMQTIYSVIADPDRGLLHVSEGNPCTEAYSTYAIE